jgi:hypothetical protein
MELFNLWIPQEILQKIANKMNFMTQIKFRQICKTIRECVNHTNLKCNLYYSKYITDDFLSKNPYIRTLSLYDNKHVRNINSLKYIRKLILNYNPMPQECVCGVFGQLKKLSLINDLEVHDISSCVNLRKLTLFGTCVLKPTSLINLRKLQKICITSNETKTSEIIKIINERRTIVYNKNIEIFS